MQIHQAYEAFPIFNHLSETAGSRPETSFSSDTTANAETIESIKSRYDVTNITPWEADQAADELFAAGVSLRELLPLHHAGERFQGHMTQIAAQVYEQQEIKIEMPLIGSGEPVNLIGIAEEQLQLAKNEGRDQKGHEENIAFLKSFSSKPASNTLFAVAAAIQAALAQTEE